MRTGAGALLVSLLSAGCQIDPPYIHARYAELRAETVAVPPVVNRSLHDLSKVSVSGALQRMLGSGAIDVLQAFRGALVEGLGAKGYRAEEVDSPTAPSLERPFEAILTAEIEDWHRAAGPGTGEYEITGRIELQRLEQVGTGEALYRKRFRQRIGSAAAVRPSAAELEADVRRAGLVAVADVPPLPAMGKAP